MKIIIDGKRCQGHARCYALAPEIFDIDDEGYAYVKEGREKVTPDIKDKVMKAVKSCPEYAIGVVKD